MKLALAVTLIVAAAMGFSLREALAGSPALWAGLGVPYLLLGAYTLYRLHDAGTLSGLLRPRGGDVSIGFVMAGVLFGGAWGMRSLMFSGGSPKIVWLFRIGLQLGSLRPSPGMLALVAGIAALEELVWRGLVLGALTGALGARRAWPLTAVLYSAAHLPTVFTLSDPVAGPNPLVVLAALGAGLVWSFSASVLGRLVPAIVSHAAFSYFTVAVLLPRLG
jgi:membrane protease YdiL (CAAX protease family)